ncbi:hypothetical protein LMG26689_00292 [Achromobacter animicus]|uniref:hypothetical protein n=1 Tax=Achromobacter animicus TaxID=1389935 RepID=UPI00146694F7|nr:hypothetical protein [Achromobacter animicus]CAB3817690.1 hypothetical protein LMG26689_00292 [Achromobacter animicus]
MIYFFGALLLASTLAAAVYRRMQRRPEDSGHAMSRDMLSGAAIFAFMGPAVAIVPIAVTMSIGAQDPELLLFGLYGLPWAYLFGGVPALFCGLTAGALKPVAPSWLAILRMGLIGAAYAFVFLLTFGSRDRSLAALGFPLFMGALPAAVAGLLCARVFYGKPVAIR